MGNRRENLFATGDSESAIAVTEFGRGGNFDGPEIVAERVRASGSRDGARHSPDDDGTGRERGFAKPLHERILWNAFDPSRPYFADGKRGFAAVEIPDRKPVHASFRFSESGKKRGDEEITILKRAAWSHARTQKEKARRQNSA